MDPIRITIHVTEAGLSHVKSELYIDDVLCGEVHVSNEKWEDFMSRLNPDAISLGGDRLDWGKVTGSNGSS